MQRLFKFNGGVKPAYNKEASTRLPIAVAPTPTLLVIPLHQSIGGMPRPLVKPGERVLKGQRIGGADGNVSSAVHASTSGTVIAVEMRLMPHTSGLSAMCVVIEPDGRDEWIPHGPFDFRGATPMQIHDYLRDSGVVGLGGAVFPSYLKLNPGKQRNLDTLVLNGAECEPFITCDDVLMRERAATILQGALIMRDMLGAGEVLIGIEDNKPEAIAAMEAAAHAVKTAAGESSIKLVSVPTLYPAGGAKQLIRVLTGIEVPHGKRSTDYGVQCFNVGTAYAIFEAIALGQPLISRIVTVAGNVGQPRNFEVLLGTPMRDLIALCGPLPDSDRVIMGGPMMGLRMPDDSVPVVKAANCVLVGSRGLFPPPPPEMPCIRCGECAKACPADLQPFELYWFARAKIFGKAQEYDLFDCIECGCCAYVCPSHIPLVDYYRFAKSEIWARELAKVSSDEARERYEFRMLREEREKQDHAAKLAAKAAARREKAAAAKTDAAKETATPEQDEKKALVAAALERVRAQKEQIQPENTINLTPEQVAEVAAIETRRAEIREMAKPHVWQDD
ncbi:MAG: electron transport complex subunit RsxC [Rhodocyclales bacterium GWA2_65_19]|nr:MAG: electron transport complex subunit RsxC [Rhodocyclales bacterium GWA2_65_19]